MKGKITVDEVYDTNIDKYAKVVAKSLTDLSKALKDAPETLKEAIRLELNKS